MGEGTGISLGGSGPEDVMTPAAIGAERLGSRWRLARRPAVAFQELAEDVRTEHEHLGAELRIGAAAEEHEVSNEADELVGEAEKHACGHALSPRQSAGETAGPAREELRPASAWGRQSN